MAFTVQTPGGAVAGANAYITVAYFDTYHEDRGNAIGTYGPPEKQTAIIRATDYMDATWEYLGLRTFEDQTLEWPRTGVFTRPELNEIDDQSIPEPVARACAELAFAALTQDLEPNAAGEDKILASQSQSAGGLSVSQSWSGMRQGSPLWKKASKIIGPFTAANELMRS